MPERCIRDAFLLWVFLKNFIRPLELQTADLAAYMKMDHHVKPPLSQLKSIAEQKQYFVLNEQHHSLK